MLRRDTRARIQTGLSGVGVFIPAATAAKATAETTLGSVDIGDGFTKKAGAFWNEAALRGQTPILRVHATVALGGLNLRGTAGG